MENIFKLLDYRKDDPINLDNKVDKFIDWCKKNMKKKSYADEINELTWAIGKLRLLAYDSDSKNYVCGDSSLWRKGIA